MLMVTVVYGAGIVLADQTPASFPVFAPLLAGALVACGALRCPRVRPWLIYLLLFLTGAANLIRDRALLSPHDLRRLLEEEPRIARVRGTLRETPFQRTHERDEEQTWRTLAEVAVTEILLHPAPGEEAGPWRPAHGRVLVSTPGLLPREFFGGRAIEAEGVLRPPRSPIVEGVFDYRAHLRRQGVHYQLFAASSNAWTLRGDPRAAVRPPVADRFGDWAKVTLARGLPGEDPPLRLLWAMTLGWKTALSGEVSEPFMRSGTMHVFAISGLHIALIAGLLVAWLRVFRVPRWLCAWIVIPLVWGYTGVTGWQASAVRSTIMATVILSGWTLRRPSDLLNSLATAAFVILLWEPQQLFQASFQLSFSVVLSLALMTPFLDRVRERWLAPESMQLEASRPAWRRWLGPPLDYLARSFAVSVAAWLGSLPLIAWYFHLVTPVSLPANLVVVPLSSAALACNVASLMTNSWLPGVTVLFNHAAWWFMLLMIRASEWAAQFPGGAFHVRTPTAAECLCYYGLLAATLSGYLWRKPARLWSVPPLLLLAIGCVFHWLNQRSQTRLTLLPLSGGEAAYYEPAYAGQNLLVDCGDVASADFIVKPFLRSQGVNRLDHLALTHGDIHHVGGMPVMRQHFMPRQYHLSSVPFRSSAYRAQVHSLENDSDRARTTTLAQGDRIGPWTLLHPQRGDRLPHADDNTMVLRADLGGCRVLLLSDLGKPGQNLLMSRHADLRAEVLVSGLPGHTEPLADALLDSVQPRVVIITDSEYPAPQRASPRLRERLARRDMVTLYARETGAVTLTVDDRRWAITTMNRVHLSFALPPSSRTGPSPRQSIATDAQAETSSAETSPSSPAAAPAPR